LKQFLCNDAVIFNTQVKVSNSFSLLINFALDIICHYSVFTCLDRIHITAQSTIFIYIFSSVCP